MFQDSLMESNGSLKTTSLRWMWLTAAINLSIVAAMIAVPLLYPEALPRTSLTAALLIPPPPQTRHIVPAAVTTARQATTILRVDPFTAPRQIRRTSQTLMTIHLGQTTA